MYNVHVYIYTYNKSLQHAFTLKDFNLRQRKWLKLLKYYDMIVLYHLGKDNVVADALSHLSICSVSDVDETKKDIVKDVHILVRLVEV